MAIDPDFDKVLALLNFDPPTAVFSADFLHDHGPLQKTVVNYGGGFSGTNVIKFGNGGYVHAYLDPTVKRMLSIGNQAGVVAANNMLDQDFTVELWVLVATGTPAQDITFAAHWDEGAGASALQWALTFDQSGGDISATVSTDGSTPITANFDLATEGAAAGTAGFFNGTYHHIGMERSGSNLYAFVDGVMCGTPANVGSNSLFAGRTKEMTVGGHWNDDDVVGMAYGGGLDDFRVTKGVARYSGANYTVPTAAHIIPGRTSPALLSAVLS